MLFFADTACRVPTLVCSNSLRCARPSLSKEGQLFCCFGWRTRRSASCHVERSRNIFVFARKADTACRVPTLVCSNSLRCARPSLAKEGQLFRAIKTLPLLKREYPKGVGVGKTAVFFCGFWAGLCPPKTIT